MEPLRTCLSSLPQRVPVQPTAFLPARSPQAGTGGASGFVAGPPQGMEVSTSRSSDLVTQGTDLLTESLLKSLQDVVVVTEVSWCSEGWSWPTLPISGTSWTMPGRGGQIPLCWPRTWSCPHCMHPATCSRRSRLSCQIHCPCLHWPNPA